MAVSGPSPAPRYDMVVIGGGLTALSIAADAKQRGLSRVLVVAAIGHPSAGDVATRYGIVIRLGFHVSGIESVPDGEVIVESEEESLRAGFVVQVTSGRGGASPFPIAPSLVARIHTAAPVFDPTNQDVLVVGTGDGIVDDADELVAGGARVVVSVAGSESSLSRLARERLARLEFERRLTVLWRSVPSTIEDVEGFPMVYFDDRRTPDLQFDHVVLGFPDTDRSERQRNRVFTVRSTADPGDPMGPGSAWQTIAAATMALLPRPQGDTAPVTPGREVDALRLEHYNATITHFDFSHQDLWVLRIRPDHRDMTHRPGQYATLGLGYWEPRVDDADEGLSDAKQRKLIRRSYSISSRVFDGVGYLVDDASEPDIELYVVHVRPEGDRIPALTPRLAAKRVGDRIYLGPKVAGRYTLDPVTHPDLQVVFLATGTGEAPHNAMLTELFRKGHRGPLVSMVTVRHLQDLGYGDVHRRLEELYSNYRYVTLPTREADIPKRYIQDVIRDGELDTMLEHGLDPARTHVFLCGNPAMIGLPTWEESEPVFADAEDGVIRLLHDRGFTIDRRGVVGNVHFEEYW